MMLREGQVRPVFGKPPFLPGDDALSAARGLVLGAVVSSAFWLGLAITLSTVW